MKIEERGPPFTRAVKLAAVQRMAKGANVTELSRELGVSRKTLYQWQKRFGGPTMWRGDGRRRAEAELQQAMAAPDPSDALSRALARIAALERMVGQQAADLDFFRKALQHVGEERQPSGVPGGTASTKSSRR